MAIYNRAQRLIIGLLIFAILNLFIGCKSYYKINEYRSDAVKAQELLAEHKGKDKYFIVVQGDDRREAEILAVTDSTVEVSLYNLPLDRLRLHESIESRRNKAYKPDRKGNRTTITRESAITQEVRIYVASDAILAYDNTTISLADIEQIDIYDRNSELTAASHFLGILGGTALVLALIIAIALATKSSCPFVYTWNGDHYVLAGETYGGAIFASLERSDYLPLKQMPAVEGEYHLRIANELKERQYINQTELLAIEHPANSEILVDKYGAVRTLLSPMLPEKALGPDERDYSDKIKSTDLDAFSFNVGEEDVSYLDLTFAKPPNANNVGKLVLNAKNSLWLEYVFGKYMKQFGSLYDGWAERMNERTGEELMAWNLNQSLPLKIYQKTVNGWEFVDYIDMVGPMAGGRDMVLPVDLSKSVGDEVEVRLETGYMFWDLDYAAMDFSADLEFAVDRLKPQRATTLEGEDVSQLLTNDDDQYLTQFQIGNAVNLYYRADLPAEGMRISTVLHAKGYYEPIRTYEGMPDVASLMEFKKPGKFTAYNKEMYLEYAVGLSPTP